MSDIVISHEEKAVYEIKENTFTRPNANVYTFSPPHSTTLGVFWGGGGVT